MMTLPLAAAAAKSTLVGLDWAVIGVYFGIVAFIAWWSGRNQKDTTDYFLAGRNAGWFVIGASIFTSNIGSEHIVGLAGQGAATGMAMAHWELHAWVLIMLAYVFVPFYYRSGVYTIPEFLEKRFGATARGILSGVSLAAYVLTKVSVTVYAGAIVFEALLPGLHIGAFGPFWVGAFTTVILTGLYTVFGGMRAVLYTSAPQAIILVLGSGFITFYGLNQLSGHEGIIAGWSEMVKTCGGNAAEFALWRPLSDPTFPWLGVLIASPIIGIWYWCTDQYIVQRALTAKDMATARRGSLFGGLLKVTPVLIFLIPGLLGWTLDEKNVNNKIAALEKTYDKGLLDKESKAQKEKLEAEVNGELTAVNEANKGFFIPRELAKNDDGDVKMLIKGDQVFPTLVTRLLPKGLRGLIVACMLAALMSSLASLFNSSASLFTVDIYEKMAPNRSQKHYVAMGRVATTVVVILGMIWIPVMKQIAGGGLYQYLQNAQSYLAPPITAVFLLGVFWQRMNRAGAVWGLSVGFILGLSKLTIQAIFGAGEGKNHTVVLAQIGDFNWLYASGLLLLASIAVMVIASLMTPPPTKEQIEGLTYASITGDAKAEIKASWDKANKILAWTIGILVVGMYTYFSFWLK
ncbi:MAG: sodium:solute symporter [Pontiellaceae bacterium]|nr:sodium:solute symporter [Pontiellaceae bacterium]